MKIPLKLFLLKARVIVLLALTNPLFVSPQESEKPSLALEDYLSEFTENNENYLAEVEEWCAVIDQWLEKPLCVNNEEAEWLVEYKIISLYQLNKLKEYRYIYGDLLSVYELSYIEGWDFQSVRKVIPLVTTITAQKTRAIERFSHRSIRQSFVIKTAIHTEKAAGYKKESKDGNEPLEAVYSGSPARLAIRYDLEYRNKLAFGFRLEKDPGEPLLYNSVPGINRLKAPDLATGYLQLKKIGPVQSVIIGNYRVGFGYGVNLAGGQSAIKNRSGLSGMALQLKPQTSVSETGYFRGISAIAASGSFSFSGFASYIKADGTSVITDSLTGKPVSFSSIGRSGMHRTLTELENRKSISEKTAGGILAFRNQWLKAGMIVMYNEFNARIVAGNQPYQQFDLNGKGNLVTGISATIWLPGIYIFTESSRSRNNGFASISGMQLQPVAGVQLQLIYRYFGTDYQNWNGSGFISYGRNSAESGLFSGIRIELPAKWLIEFSTDHSRSGWVRYDLTAPSRRNEINLVIEKGWQQDKLLHFSFRSLEEDIINPDNSEWICHPEPLSQYRIRFEGRMAALHHVRLKSRIEVKLLSGFHPSWMVFQDLEWQFDLLKTKFWLRTCFFEAPDFETSIYAYENDVLYDFTSFLHYGKGLRGIFMARVSPIDILDLWLRFSTVWYTNKHAGSGWDEVKGNRQNEIEVQVRINLSG